MFPKCIASSLRPSATGYVASDLSSCKTASAELYSPFPPQAIVGDVVYQGRLHLRELAGSKSQLDLLFIVERIHARKWFVALHNAVESRTESEDVGDSVQIIRIARGMDRDIVGTN